MQAEFFSQSSLPIGWRSSKIMQKSLANILLSQSNLTGRSPVLILEAFIFVKSIYFEQIN
jgi:hypothetical protein